MNIPIKHIGTKATKICVMNFSVGFLKKVRGEVTTI